MNVKMRTRNLLIVIAVLCVLMSLPFQCRTPQGEIYRKQANRHDDLAAQFRAAERQARAKGNVKEAEQFRLQAEHAERQGWIYRKASYQH